MLTSTADPAAKKTMQLQIESKDKKLSKLLTREVSMSSNFSIEDDHGGVSVSVPFRWESQPGTPKIRFGEKPLPPLTPPPSYFFNSPKYSTKKHPKLSNNNLLGYISLFPKRSTAKKTQLPSSSPANYSLSYSSSSSASSSQSSSPWSTLYSVPSSPIRPSNGRGGGYEMSSNPRLSFDHHSRAVHDEEEHEHESPVSSSLCFGRVGNNGTSRSLYPSIIKVLLRDSR